MIQQYDKQANYSAMNPSESYILNLTNGIIIKGIFVRGIDGFYEIKDFTRSDSGNKKFPFSIYINTNYIFSFEADLVALVK
ncbi:MAG: hypothetical protein LBU60_01665 [Clostridiales bacterium]|jgi:hypothetical protein|nr:hypothetical protein [Clostridiales bacterium]